MHMNTPHTPAPDAPSNARQDALWLMLEFQWEPVLRRLTAAGWVKRSWTCDHGEVRDADLNVEFTPLGFQRLAQLRQCFAEIGRLDTPGDWICLEGLCWMAHAQSHRQGPRP